MGDMVEKCAKAIEDAIRGDSEANFVGEWLVPGKTRIDADGVDMRLVAAAVIDALMTPTIDMVCAGMDALDSRGKAPATVEVPAVYRAMLSKAKSE